MEFDKREGAINCKRKKSALEEGPTQGKQKGPGNPTKHDPQ